MGKVISFLNFKGGVGKSTSTVNTAKALHDMGYKVLVIDADAQGNSSKMMGKKASEGNDETLYEALIKGMDIRRCICLDQDKDESFDYVASNQYLGDAETDLAKMVGREKVLAKTLRPIINDYDFILIDCAPIDGLVTLNAITASEYLIVPLNGEAFALDGMGKIIQRYREIKENINENVQILGYVLTLMKKCTLHDENRKRLLKQKEVCEWPGEVFHTEIKASVHFAESAQERKNIFDYAQQLPATNFLNKNKKNKCLQAAEQYTELAKEIVTRIENL